MAKENITDQESLAEGEELTPSDGEAAGSNVGEESTESKPLHEVLSEALGKEFKDEQSAIKAVKDTFNYVGKAGQVEKELQEIKAKQDDSGNTEAPKVDPDKYVSKDEYVRDMFYEKNPAVQPYKDVIEALAKSNPDKTRDELLKTDTVKDLFEKVQAHDEAEKSKSVLHSNPRLGQVKDKLQKAQESAQQGDTQGASEAATDAVVDSFFSK